MHALTWKKINNSILLLTIIIDKKNMAQLTEGVLAVSSCSMSVLSYKNLFFIEKTILITVFLHINVQKIQAGDRIKRAVLQVLVRQNTIYFSFRLKQKNNNNNNIILGYYLGY